MEYFCAYQDRCHKETLQKLRELRMIPEAIDQIMAHLIQENYLNEERFAKSFAQGKFNIKKWGKNRIVNELKQRNISVYNIKSALAEIDENAYLATFNNLAEKRVATLKNGTGQQRRKKLVDYLLYRGWEPQLVYEKVEELLG
ncbi:regulatory protein RecX [Maribacter sp. 2-571]|uniref:regulatory protein RecX n=1 Tax=Maribacter sp. 2-571 TaxID=3417569 RepID=UPI003D351190